VAIAALKNPRLVNEKYTERDKNIMTEKIRAIFKIALRNGHDSLVVGALGCGAYHNPAAEVAKIYQQVVNEFHGCFKKVVFAILGRKGDLNLDTFTDAFGTYQPKTLPKAPPTSPVSDDEKNGETSQETSQESAQTVLADVVEDVAKDAEKVEE
jgi:hypothetical protein